MDEALRGMSYSALPRWEPGRTPGSKGFLGSSFDWNCGHRCGKLSSVHDKVVISTRRDEDPPRGRGSNHGGYVSVQRIPGTLPYIET
jgi:hypothetical protein